VNEKGKPAKSEWILLGITAMFLAVLLILFFHDRADKVPADGGTLVETQVQVPQEEILPDLSPLDINGASKEELMTLPGIGEELAGRIVAYRESEGPFETIEDIMKVSGIGEGKFAALKDRIAVGGKGEQK